MIYLFILTFSLKISLFTATVWVVAAVANNIFFPFVTFFFFAFLKRSSKSRAYDNWKLCKSQEQSCVMCISIHAFTACISIVGRSRRKCNGAVVAGYNRKGLGRRKSFWAYGFEAACWLAYISLVSECKPTSMIDLLLLFSSLWKGFLVLPIMYSGFLSLIMFRCLYYELTFFN